MLDERREFGEEVGIVFTTLRISQGLHDPVVRPPEPIDPRPGHGVVGVSERDDPRHDRDLFSGQAIRIPQAIESFVVVAHDPSDCIPVLELGGGDDTLALLRVCLHHRPVVGGLRRHFLEDGIGNADLADVMQTRGDTQSLYLAGGEPALSPQFEGSPATRSQ